MALSAVERKRNERERARLNEEERLARLLSRTIRLDLYHAADAALISIMERIGVDEPQDAISRLIHGGSRLDNETLTRLTDLK